jgi:hypothetical protein
MALPGSVGTDSAAQRDGLAAHRTPRQKRSDSTPALENRSWTKAPRRRWKGAWLRAGLHGVRNGRRAVLQDKVMLGRKVGIRIHLWQKIAVSLHEPRRQHPRSQIFVQPFDDRRVSQVGFIPKLSRGAGISR